MTRPGAAGLALALTLAVILSAAFASRTLAAPAKEYAYVFLQGRAVDPSGRRPLAGATVRLVGGGRVFEVATDREGTFRFERLPVATYELTLTTSDGRSMQRARRREDLDPDRTRLDIRVRRGGGQALLLEPRDGRLVPVVAEPPPDWGKFGKELMIFLGGALALAL